MGQKRSLRDIHKLSKLQQLVAFEYCVHTISKHWIVWIPDRQLTSKIR
jgi:hypothetical protein